MHSAHPSLNYVTFEGAAQVLAPPPNLRPDVAEYLVVVTQGCGYCAKLIADVQSKLVGPQRHVFVLDLQKDNGEPPSSAEFDRVMDVVQAKGVPLLIQVHPVREEYSGYSNSLVQTLLQGGKDVHLGGSCGCQAGSKSQDAGAGSGVGVGSVAGSGGDDSDDDVSIPLDKPVVLLGGIRKPPDVDNQYPQDNEDSDASTLFPDDDDSGTETGSATGTDTDTETGSAIGTDTDTDTETGSATDTDTDTEDNDDDDDDDYDASSRASGASGATDASASSGMSGLTYLTADSGGLGGSRGYGTDTESD